jgi:hypothetical protein
MVDDNQRRRYSLNGSTGSPKPAAPVAGPKAPAAPAKPVNTSSFLTRIANTAIREGGAPPGAPSSAANPRWMQIDHSSPAANLNSRLRWVENAFKAPAPNQAPSQVQQQQAPQAPPQSAQAPTQAAVQAQNSIAAAPDLKTAVGVMRKRLLSIHEQIAAFDCELAEIEKKL